MAAAKDRPAFELRSLTPDLDPSRRSDGAHPQELGDAIELPHEPDGRRHEPELRIDDQLGLDQVDVSPTGPHLAFAGDHDVLQPLHVGAVGEGEHVELASAEDVDRRPVRLARRSTDVRQDGKGRQPAREVDRQPIEHPARERAKEADASWGNCSYTGGIAPGRERWPQSAAVITSRSRVANASGSPFGHTRRRESHHGRSGR